jgi:hypothetical protein
MINFESNKHAFPGYVNRINKTAAAGAAGSYPVSWVVMLFPYLERNDLYTLWATSTNPYDSLTTAVNASPTIVNLKLLVCPSDAADTTMPWLSYVCNRGINGVNNTAYGVCQDQYTSGTAPPLSLDFISAHDGATTTLLLAESVLTNPANPPSLVFPRNDSNNPHTNSPYWTSTGSKTANPSLAINAMEVDVGFEWGTFFGTAVSPSTVTPGNGTIGDKILSAHYGGSVVSFCDGHQQFLNTTVDRDVFRQLATPWGAQVTASVLKGLSTGNTITKLETDGATNILPVLDEGSF